MPTPNPFTTDAFSLIELTAAINKAPYKPMRIQQLGLFEEQGLVSTTASVDVRDGVLSVIEVRPRGAPAKQIGNEVEASRKAIPFLIPHLPAHARILAHEVQNVRAFGTEGEPEDFETVRDERVASMRADLDYTNEIHRVHAIMGEYKDAGGDWVSLFTTFGVAQQSHVIPLGSASSGIRGEMFNVRKKIRAGMGGTPWGNVRVLCGDAFWGGLLEDADVKETYLNQVQAAELRGDPTNRFTAYGATWEWYEGTTECNFGDDAYAIPEAQGLFITRYAPADTMDAIGTRGLPYYASAELIDHNKGVDLEAQSNPLNLCTRPNAVIKITIS